MMITRPSIRNNGRSHSSVCGVSAQSKPKPSFPGECLHKGRPARIAACQQLLQQQGRPKSHERLGIIR